MLRPTLSKARWLAPALALALGAAFAGPAAAQTKEVKVALIAPLSGPWARQGELMRKGAELAIADINAAGGVKLPDGPAKMVLITADAGDSAEKAKNSAQRLLAEQTDLSGGTGAWLSSFTLAITEVTERAKLPWLTLSYSGQITDRGFEHVFQTSATADVQSKMTLDLIIDLAKTTAAGVPKKVAFIADNTAAPTGFLKPLRDSALKEKGMELVVDEIYTPPMADATPSVQKVRAARPDLLFIYTTGTTDVKQVMEKLKEFRLDKGRLPVTGNGAQFGTPELGNVVGKDLLEGYMFTVANWGAKPHGDLLERFKKATGEPWLTQDSLCTYGDMWVFKAAIEKAGSPDREKVSAAMRQLDDSMAKYYAGGTMKFDAKGRREGAGLYAVQWINGEPVTVFPKDVAVAEPIWGAK